MIDLFGLEQQTPRKHDRPEAAALVVVLKVPRAQFREQYACAREVLSFFSL